MNLREGAHIEEIPLISKKPQENNDYIEKKPNSQEQNEIDKPRLSEQAEEAIKRLSEFNGEAVRTHIRGRNYNIRSTSLKVGNAEAYIVGAWEENEDGTETPAGIFTGDARKDDTELKFEKNILEERLTMFRLMEMDLNPTLTKFDELVSFDIEEYKRREEERKKKEEEKEKGDKTDDENTEETLDNKESSDDSEEEKMEEITDNEGEDKEENATKPKPKPKGINGLNPDAAFGVATEYRGTGLASALFEIVTETAHQKGFKQVIAIEDATISDDTTGPDDLESFYTHVAGEGNYTVREGRTVEDDELTEEYYNHLLKTDPDGKETKEIERIMKENPTLGGRPTYDVIISTDLTEKRAKTLNSLFE